MNNTVRSISFMFVGAVIAILFPFGSAHGAGYGYQAASKGVSVSKWKTVVGCNSRHVVENSETMLDIARNYELGWNEIEILYPDIDPWIPDAGTELTIPSTWVLPAGRTEGIVVNLPEMRLYRYIPGTKLVETYPVGIGTEEFSTPTGEYSVVGRQEKPVWTVPPSLREKYDFTSMPPGPNNPLGEYWLGLSANHIGIHGTNFPWAVGRQVSRGCIRLYPEHIKKLFPEVAVGTDVQIVYEPVKIGVLDENIYIEAHPDADGVTSDFENMAAKGLEALGEKRVVSEALVAKVLQEKNGMPVCVGKILGGGDMAGTNNDYMANKAVDKISN